MTVTPDRDEVRIDAEDNVNAEVIFTVSGIDLPVPLNTPLNVFVTTRDETAQGT